MFQVGGDADAQQILITTSEVRQRQEQVGARGKGQFLPVLSLETDIIR